MVYDGGSYDDGAGDDGGGSDGDNGQVVVMVRLGMVIRW